MTDYFPGYDSARDMFENDEDRGGDWDREECDCPSCRANWIDDEPEGDNETPETDDEGYQMTDGEADADTLASAGWGTDEDYGDFGDNGFYDE